MSIIEKIISDLNEVLASFDADNAAKAREWAKGRVAALAAFEASAERKEMGRDQWKLYGRRFEIAGGKTWYGIFNGRNEAMINEFMDKNSAATVDKRNALIAKKLAAFDVTEVISNSYARKEGGFDCTIVIETNAGRKVVAIDTIVAGGYNIQCLHNRTLVKVR